MLQNLFYILILILGFPSGLILAHYCKDEIKNWEKRFSAIVVISVILSVIISFINFNYKFPVIISLFFIAITSLTIIWKSLSIK
jgi:hypothetical protein